MRKKVLETAKITHIDKYIHPYSRYWDAYYTIVNSHYYDICNKGYHCHHIVPKCLFDLEKDDKLNSMKDNPYNMVYVPKDVHALLHYLLYKSARPGWFKDAMYMAWKSLSK